MNTHEVGDKYQDYVRDALRYVGYQCESTPNSHDKGCDLVLTINPYCKIAIQCKWSTSAKVNYRAVQEIVAAKAVYDAAFCAVVTNNKYTLDAYELAETNGVVMISGFGYNSSVFDIVSELGLMPTVVADMFGPVLDFASGVTEANRNRMLDGISDGVSQDEDDADNDSTIGECDEAVDTESELTLSDDVENSELALDGSIEQLRFHKKTLRVLKNAYIFSIEDLLEKDKDALSLTIGVDHKVLHNILSVMEDAGLMFNKDVAAIEEAEAEVDAVSRCLNDFAPLIKRWADFAQYDTPKSCLRIPVRMLYDCYADVKNGWAVKNNFTKVLGYGRFCDDLAMWVSRHKDAWKLYDKSIPTGLYKSPLTSCVDGANPLLREYHSVRWCENETDPILAHLRVPTNARGVLEYIGN